MTYVRDIVELRMRIGARARSMCADFNRGFRRRLALQTGSAAVAALLATGSVLAQDRSQPEKPPVKGRLPTPPTRVPAGVVAIADYRYDDLLWENDRIAHRIYGHALEAAEPPSGSGIDSWGKNVPWPFADRQLRFGHQHDYHGEGLDYYNVGTGRGAGGLGVWLDNKLWTSRNYVRHRILQTGGRAADFQVDYAPWPVDTQRKVWETRRFTLPLGTQFTRLVSTISSDKPGQLTIGIGIGKRTTGPTDGELTIDRARGLLSWWGPDDGVKGRMMVAIRVDPSSIAGITSDYDNHLVLIRVRPGKPFVYYSGSAWSKGEGGFRTRAAWDTYTRDAQLDFKVPPTGK